MSNQTLDRWYPLIENAAGRAYSMSRSRFNVVPAGRRSGKTERAKRKWVRRAVAFGLENPHISDGLFVFGAPTYRQARNIFWSDLKAMTPPEVVANVREVSMSIELVTGVTMACIGLDKPERHEGRPIDGGVLDEYASMKSSVWTKHLRPALSTKNRQGSLDFTGVPEGRNHYYDLYQFALSEESGDDWSAFTWESIEILSQEEIDAAMRDLDELTFNQEYRASFISFQGQAYYAYHPDLHVRSGLPYDPSATLILCFDFNRSPGVAVIAQEHTIDGQQTTCVIGEVHIPADSNTVKVARAVLDRWGEHQGMIEIYGDASGGAKNASAIMGSDWDLIREVFNPVWGGRMDINLPSKNPPERTRVNAMNAHLQSIDGTIRMLFDPEARQTIKDVEGVRAKEDGSIDKSDLSLTHSSDALGYYVVYRYPVDGSTGPTTEVVY